MNEQELVRFVKWLPSNINEFKDKTPEEVVTILNKMSQTEEGMNTISELINQFKQNSQMFKKGGKLDILINKFKPGGKPKVVRQLNYVQGMSSLPPKMEKLDYNKEYSDGYRASQFSNKKGDLIQFLQRPNVLGGTKRYITNNLQDTTYVVGANSATYKNKPLPWYTPKANEEHRKERFNWLTSRFAEYFPIKK